MRTLFLAIITTVLSISIYPQNPDVKGDKDFKWGEKQKEEKIKNLQDPTKWDMEMLSGDLQQVRPKLANENMDFGVFPAPKYKQGLGTGQGANRDYFGKTLYWNYFVSEKNQINQGYLMDKKDEVFFTIICLTDVLDFSNDKYNTTASVNSRNYPDRLGSGVVQTKTTSIEYIAFVTADRKQFALVNQRIFDLDQGQLILVAPQKDGSLRSMQIKTPLMESAELPEYIKKFIQTEYVKEFFLNKNNI